MKFSQLKVVLILGTVSIIGILSIQVFWLARTFELKQVQFNQTIHNALLNVVERMSPESISNENIINQLSSDYFVVNVNDIINANVLEYYLANEFKKLQLILDYEYAIYNCKTDKMMYGCYVNAADHTDVAQSTNLQTYNEYIYYFGVKFPTKSSYVLNKMRVSIILSGILFLFIFFFGYALFFIIQQKRKSELQTDFINNMTHEFKTPIASISLASNVLLKSKSIKDDRRLENFSKIILEQSERLNLQVEKILQLAKDQNNLLELKIEKIRLDNLLQTVIRSSIPNYQKRDGTIVFNNTNTEFFVLADRLHLTNILHNILDNSLKYCTKKPMVHIALKKKNKTQFELTISDNGIGIETKYLSQILDKFFRVPSGNIHNVKGFGLGLYYVKKVVDQHEWQLKIDSKLNQGTTIKIVGSL